MSLELVLLVETCRSAKVLWLPAICGLGSHHPTVGWEALETIGWEAINNFWGGRPFQFGWEAISNFLDGNAFFQLVAEKPAAKFGGGKPLWAGKPSKLVAGKPFTLVAGKPSNNIWAGKPLYTIGWEAIRQHFGWEAV